MAGAAELTWRQLIGGERARLTAGIVLVEAIAAVQASVLAAVMPAVRNDLGGTEYYGLVFATYVLAALAATPAAAAYADRLGPGRPFTAMIGVFVAGSLLCTVAPSMPLLAAARAVQGFGGGAQYTIVYGAMAKAYPESGRAKMLALLSAVWVVPGLVGPGFGSVVAATVGWRWCFAGLLPLAVIAFFMVIPDLRRLPAAAGQTGSAASSLPWPFLLAAGTGLLLTAPTQASRPLALGLALLGAICFGPALLKVLPAGTFALRRGLPATIAASLLMFSNFFVGFNFLPLMATAVGHQPLLVAGVGISLVNLTWTLGAWWQARVTDRWPHRRVAFWSCAALSTFTALTAMPLLGLPLAPALLAWAGAGFAIGVANNTCYLAAIEAATGGTETAAVGALQVVNRLGISLGTGLAGAGVAVAGVRGGLWGAFAFATLAAAGAAFMTTRFPLTRAEAARAAA